MKSHAALNPRVTAAREARKRARGAPPVEERHDPNASGLGAFLRGLREKAGLSQRDVAIALDLGTYQFVYNLEKEKCVPPMKHLKQLAKLYRVDETKLRVEIVKHLYARLKRKYGFV